MLLNTNYLFIEENDPVSQDISCSDPINQVFFFFLPNNGLKKWAKLLLIDGQDWLTVAGNA